MPKFLPADIPASSPEGLRLLGLSPEVHIRVCSFGATDIVTTLLAVPGVVLYPMPIEEAQNNLKKKNLWWKDNPLEDLLDDAEDNRWSHSGLIHWPRGVIHVPINTTTRKPFGPFFARHNKEPWFESVRGVTSQFDTKRVKLPVDSITLYLPMILDTMSWRLTAEKYPNHWSNRVGKPRSSVKTIKEALTRPVNNFNATAVRIAKRFFMAAVNSHCAGPSAYLRSVTIRELFAFAVVRMTGKSVHMSGACPLRDRWRTGPVDPELRQYRSSSAVDQMALHRFSITFENSATSGYFTEKIVNAYLAESIPIYFGPPRSQIERVLNLKAFIHCDLPQNLTSDIHLHGIVKSLCEGKTENDCYKLYETEVEKELTPYFEICINQIQELAQDNEKYEAMLSEPLVNLDDNGDPTGIWDPKQMGKVVRVAMTAFGYD